MSALSDLFPKARAEVLRLLFETGDQEIHLRDLARLAALSPAALQKELTSLAAKQLVLTRRDGNRLYYRANTAHPLYPELHGITLKTSGIAAELARALAPVQGIDVALIFGSVAAGTATAKSDVDLLVIGSVGLRKLIPALRGLADSLGREINPICLTPAEWHQNRAKGDAFTTRVSSEPKLWLKGGPDALAAVEGYHNRAISTMEVIEELIKLAKDLDAATKRGEDMGLTDDEIAFYDALASNESAVVAMGDDKLKVIAAELISQVKKSVTIDWTLRESARARIKVMVKRILNKHGYPPDLQEEAVKTVLAQAELLCVEWV